MAGGEPQGEEIQRSESVAKCPQNDSASCAAVVPGGAGPVVVAGVHNRNSRRPAVAGSWRCEVVRRHGHGTCHRRPGRPATPGRACRTGTRALPAGRLAAVHLAPGQGDLERRASGTHARHESGRVSRSRTGHAEVQHPRCGVLRESRVSRYARAGRAGRPDEYLELYVGVLLPDERGRLAGCHHGGVVDHALGRPRGDSRFGTAATDRHQPLLQAGLGGAKRRGGSTS